MGWQVKITQAAQDDLNALDGTIQKRIIEKLEWISEHFDSITPIQTYRKLNYAHYNIPTICRL